MGGRQNPKGPKTTNFDWGLHGVCQSRLLPEHSSTSWTFCFAVEEDSESEDMFSIADRPPWTGQSNPDPLVPTTIQQMFALAQKMGYEMRPIARRLDNTCQPSGSPRAPFTPSQGYHPPFNPVVILLGSSASVVVNLDILRLVALSLTRLFRINQPVGICNLNSAPPQGNSI